MLCGMPIYLMCFLLLVSTSNISLFPVKLQFRGIPLVKVPQTKEEDEAVN
jgi:hypothetical protein